MTTAIAAEPLRYAGFWRRLLAWCVDMLLVVLMLVPIAVFHGVLFGVVGGVLGQDEADVEALAENIDLGVSGIVTWLYFAILESSVWQATFGKRALGIAVTDMAGRRIGFGRATGRHFAKLLSGLFAGVGFLMIAWSSERQGLHDGLAKTLVVRRAPRGLTAQGGPCGPSVGA